VVTCANGRDYDIDFLNETRRDVIETIYRNYFEAGVYAVETKYVRLQSG
jgi:methionine synthase I (cobalamin-dependent)